MPAPLVLRTPASRAPRLLTRPGRVEAGLAMLLLINRRCQKSSGSPASGTPIRAPSNTQLRDLAGTLFNFLSSPKDDAKIKYANPFKKTDRREILSPGTLPGEKRKKKKKRRKKERNLAANSESCLLEIDVKLNY